MEDDDLLYSLDAGYLDNCVAFVAVMLHLCDVELYATLRFLAQ